MARRPAARPGSARAANASTPGAPSGAQHAAPSDQPSNQGSAAAAAAPSVTAAHWHRRRPPPAGTRQTTVTAAASSSPVGVSPANAIQNASAKNPGQARERAQMSGFSGGWAYICAPSPAASVPADRNASVVAATHGRQP
ncbi:hypothetical protein C1Y40_03691 [Mycobacterium talmoniae]|uniref:Uncharacterized protein n=1 Tax=Mycobacterium talmoniae TaxID=1858794 RepID=A0A2S8BHQ1_9MYCO|nr:hypothetical protein C1Y40_03691 [Mycobacterium talmoniae]